MLASVAAQQGRIAMSHLLGDAVNRDGDMVGAASPERRPT